MLYYDEETRKRKFRNALIAFASVFFLFIAIPAIVRGISTNHAEPESPAPSQSTTPTVTTNQSAETQTAECLIKGNISKKGEKIYHVPGQQYYDDTIIIPSKGERYFCTEAEAKAAGWRKSKV